MAQYANMDLAGDFNMEENEEQGSGMPKGNKKAGFVGLMIAKKHLGRTHRSYHPDAIKKITPAKFNVNRITEPSAYITDAFGAKSAPRVKKTAEQKSAKGRFLSGERANLSEEKLAELRANEKARAKAYRDRKKAQAQPTGGKMPMPKTFLEGAKASYQQTPPMDLPEGFHIVFNTPTLDAYLNDTTKTMLVCLRGTKPTDKQDLYADAMIAVNQLSKTPRYMADKEALGRLFQMFSPQEYEYYLTGHSLGGAIVNSLKRDFPMLKNAIEYNPAFQPYDLISQQASSIKRNYVSTDPLYRLGGRFFSNTNVVQPSKNPLPNLGAVGELYNSYAGHALDNFVGGKMVKMPEGQYLAEHANLLNVLAHPTPTKLKREYRKQKKEVEGEMGR
jgi:hypothetical protein